MYIQYIYIYIFELLASYRKGPPSISLFKQGISNENDVMFLRSGKWSLFVHVLLFPCLSLHNYSIHRCGHFQSSDSQSQFLALRAKPQVVCREDHFGTLWVAWNEQWKTSLKNKLFSPESTWCVCGYFSAQSNRKCSTMPSGAQRPA